MRPSTHSYLTRTRHSFATPTSLELLDDELVPQIMPLASLTGSPVQSPPNEDRIPHVSDSLLGSNGSGSAPLTENFDGIYNAQLITSHEEPSRETHSVSDCGAWGNAYMGQKKKVQSEGGVLTTDWRSGQPSNEDRHGWSDDLEYAVQIQTLIAGASCERSPSSDEALQAAANINAYPHLPPQPPPHREPTPDGIPSFGTRSAQRLRLVPPSRLHRLGKLLQSSFQNRRNLQEHIPGDDGARNVDQPTHERARHNQSEGAADVLRRATGMTRPRPVATAAAKPQRIALPRGVKMVWAPGDLTVADDGSHVRGKFGYRVSGHGVGQRALDTHPLARRQRSDAVESAIHAIDKACEREAMRTQQLPGSLISESHRVLDSELERLERLRGGNVHPLQVPAATHAPENECLAFRAVEEQRRESERPRIGLRAWQMPYAALSTLLNWPGSLNPEASVSNPAQVRQESSMSSPRSNTFRAPLMNEPLPYGAGYPRDSHAQTGTIDGSSSDRARRAREEPGFGNEGSESAACWRRICGDLCRC